MHAPASEPTAGIVAPPPLIYLVPLALGLWLKHWFPRHAAPPRLAAPVGIACVLLGLVGIPAMLAFRRARTSWKPWRPSKVLVTDGPYRYSRNPMYLGFTLLYLGITIWVNVLWPVLFLPLVLLMMQVGVISREEAYLERRFGDDYRAYRARVRRWI